MFYDDDYHHLCCTFYELSIEYTIHAHIISSSLHYYCYSLVVIITSLLIVFESKNVFLLSILFAILSRLKPSTLLRWLLWLQSS